MHCAAQTTAIAQLWRGIATPQGAQSEVLRAARDLFSVALEVNAAEDLRPVARLFAEVFCGVIGRLALHAKPNAQTRRCTQPQLTA
jgi:hypothetical protein